MTVTLADWRAALANHAPGDVLRVEFVDLRELVERIERAEAALAATAWQFNEAVSLLREARSWLDGDGDAIASEIDEGLPAIHAALEAAAGAS